MTSTYQAWVVEERPIYSRLPECYKDNNIADILTVFWDELLINLKDKIYDIPRQLDPETCDPIWLDFLAPLCGFTGEYWDTKWDTQAKRTLLLNSYSFIWKNKGTQEVLSFILNTLGIDHKIWTGQAFVLGVSKVSIDRLGDAVWEYKILLPSYYTSEGNEFKLARKINSLFGPLWCKSEVRYERDIIETYLIQAAAVNNQTFLDLGDDTLLQLN